MCVPEDFFGSVRIRNEEVPIPDGEMGPVTITLEGNKGQIGIRDAPWKNSPIPGI